MLPVRISCLLFGLKFQSGFITREYFDKEHFPFLKKPFSANLSQSVYLSKHFAAQKFTSHSLVNCHTVTLQS